MNESRQLSVGDRLQRIERLLVLALGEELMMAAEQSQEATDLQAAIDALEVQVQAVAGTDSAVENDLAELLAQVKAIGPVSPDQVAAVTAVTSTLASLTSKLAAAGGAAVAPAPPVEAPAPAPEAAPAPAEAPVPAEAPAEAAPAQEPAAPSSEEPQA